MRVRDQSEPGTTTDTRAPSKARWTSTIRIKLILTVIVAAVIPLLIVGYASSTKQQALELEDAFTRLDGLATVPADETTATLEHLVAVVPRLEAVALYDGEGAPVAADMEAIVSPS